MICGNYIILWVKENNTSMKTISNIASILFVAFAVLGFISCTSHQEKVSNETYNLTLDETTVKKATFIDDFCDFTFIPLETNEKCLLSSIKKLIVTDEAYYLLNAPQIGVFSFNRDGSYRCNIGTMGHAQNEYQRVINIGANQAGDTVAVLDFAKVNFYDRDGKFLFSKEQDAKTCAEDISVIPGKYVLGSFHRQGNNHLLSSFNFADDGQESYLDVSSEVIREMLPMGNFNYIQTSRDKLCCYDMFSSSFHVIDLKNGMRVKSYYLNANDMITEEKLKNDDRKPDKYNYVWSYVFADHSILGTISRNENTNLDFRIDLEKQTLELTDHEILYSFDCYHDGYFYQVWPAENILDLIHPMIKSMYDKNVNPALYNLRETLLEALGPIKDTIKEGDNPYLLRMKLK